MKKIEKILSSIFAVAGSIGIILLIFSIISIF